MKPARSLICLGAVFFVWAAAAEEPYEKPVDLKAADFLDASLLKGPNHEVEEMVVSDGIFNTYTIDSKFGTWKVQGNNLAAVRVHEVGAIAQLKEVDKIGVAAGGIAKGALNVGKSAVTVATHPAETIVGFPEGIYRLFGRLGRGASRTSEKLGTTDTTGTESENLSDPKDAPPATQASTTGKAATATGEVAKDLIGVNSSMRFWAKKIHVDPYTRNEILHNELRDVAQYDAGGQLAVNLAPGGVILTALNTTATVNDLIWMKEPDELVTLNEKRLKDMGVKSSVSKAFRLNPQYNLTRQVRLLASLDQLPRAEGRAGFVARAAGAKADSDGEFYMESAMLADLFNKTQAPVLAIVDNLPGACVIAGDNRFACLFPLDYIFWTEGVAGHINRITKRAETDYPKATKEMWLTGRASERTAKELAARGWSLREKGLKLISEDVQPEPPPQPTPSVPVEKKPDTEKVSVAK
ncbi:MAG TPA: hypothetical protein VKJ00_11975 [Thermoanaerobaculia bacterium]|nr:hypothetical protein [Thermoanaerobaculia bacterium]